jgi:DNA polymerase-3 subunit epsilon
VGKSATVHGLLDHEVAEGVALEEALAELFTAARGRLWVFHHAPLDIAFLQGACKSWLGATPPFAALDTLALERSRRQRREQPVRPGDLQLAALRDIYGLPHYAAHNALLDAFATAELLLAMLAHSDSRGKVDLSSLVVYN